MKISDIKPNPQNPRTIKDENFKKLVQSIKDFPEMLDSIPEDISKKLVNKIDGEMQKLLTPKELELTGLVLKSRNIFNRYRFKRLKQSFLIESEVKGRFLCENYNAKATTLVKIVRAKKPKKSLIARLKDF